MNSETWRVDQNSLLLSVSSWELSEGRDGLSVWAFGVTEWLEAWSVQVLVSLVATFWEGCSRVDSFCDILWRAVLSELCHLVLASWTVLARS